MAIRLNAKGWFSTLSCWKAAIYTIDQFWEKGDVKMMMMMTQLVTCLPYVNENIKNMNKLNFRNRYVYVEKDRNQPRLLIPIL